MTQRKIDLPLVLLAVICPMFITGLDAQTPNWVKTTTNEVDGLGYGHCVTSISFTDGLGREVQTQTQDIVNGNVFISGTEYDAAGRPVKTVKPYKISNPSLGYYTPTSIINEANIYHNDISYSETQYSDDPLGRVTAAGAPGASFTISSGHCTRSWTLGIRGPGATQSTYFSNPSGFIQYSYLFKHETDLDSKKYMDGISQDQIKYTLTVTKDPNGHFTQTMTDLFGNVRFTWSKTSTDANQTADEIISEYRYDIVGNKLSEIPPAVQSAPVAATTYTYNTLGQVISKTIPDAGTVNYAYDDVGRLQSTTDANGFYVTYTYDNLGRALTTSRLYGKSLSTRIRTIYDDPSAVSAFIANSQITSNKLSLLSNTRGRAVATIAYDDNFYAWSGNIATDEAAYAGKVIDLYSYDDEGRVSEKYTSIPGLPLQWRTYTYDLQGKLHFTYYYSYSSPTTQWYTERKYDKNGRLQQIKLNGSPFVQYVYDDMGRVSKKLFGSSSPYYSVQYSYNVRDWVNFISANVENGSTDFWEGPKYDDATSPQYNGNIGEIGYQLLRIGPYGGFKMQYTYDGVNRLTNVNDGTQDYNDLDASFSYYNDGRFLTKKESGSSNWGVYNYYNNSNRLKSIDASPKSGAEVNKVNYIYDNNGNMVMDRSKNMVIDYDWRNLPVKFSIYSAIPSDVTDYNSIYAFRANSVAQSEIVMTYNASGNRIKKEVLSPANAPIPLDQTSCPDPNATSQTLRFTNGTTTYGLKSDGTLQICNKRIDAPANSNADISNSLRFEYYNGTTRSTMAAICGNSIELLGSVKGCEINSSGLQFWSGSYPEMAIDQSGNLLLPGKNNKREIKDGVAYCDDAVFTFNSTTNSYNISYADVGSEGIERANGNPEYYVKDHLGSTRLVVASDKTIAEAIDYLAFGKQIERKTPPEKARETFTGKEFDNDGAGAINGAPGIGLYYFGKRYYDPEIGGFISTDPAGQYFNSYCYGGGNPMIGTDPDGNEYMVGDNGQFLAGPPQNSNDPSVFYGATKIGEVGGTVDVSTIFSNFLNNNIETAKHILSPFTFRDLVKTNGPWDIKNNSAYIYSLKGQDFSFNGGIFSGADLGNMSYGATGQHLWFACRDLLLRKAGEYQILSGTSRPEWQHKINGVMMAPYGDDPRDQEMIWSGFQYSQGK